MKFVYLHSINFHDQRPSTISACFIVNRGHGHVAKNVENVISQNQWVAFALPWSARNKIGTLSDESVDVPDSKMANGSCDLTESYSRSWNKGIQICGVRQKRSIKRNQTSGCYSWSPGRQRSRCLARYCWTIIYNSTPDRQLPVGFYRLG